MSPVPGDVSASVVPPVPEVSAAAMLSVPLESAVPGKED